MCADERRLRPLDRAHLYGTIMIFSLYYVRLSLFHCQDDFAHILSTVKNVVRCFCFRDGQHLVDRRLHLTGLHFGPHITYQTGQDFRLHLRRSGSKGAADDAHIAHIDILQIDLGMNTSKRCNHDPAGAILQITQRHFQTCNGILPVSLCNYYLPLLL